MEKFKNSKAKNIET